MPPSITLKWPCGIARISSAVGQGEMPDSFTDILEEPWEIIQSPERIIES